MKSSNCFRARSYTIDSSIGDLHGDDLISRATREGFKAPEGFIARAKYSTATNDLADMFASFIVANFDKIPEWKDMPKGGIITQVIIDYFDKNRDNLLTMVIKKLNKKEQNVAIR